MLFSFLFFWFDTIYNQEVGTDNIKNYLPEDYTISKLQPSIDITVPNSNYEINFRSCTWMYLFVTTGQPSL